jgi:hypothetical protein
MFKSLTKYFIFVVVVASSVLFWTVYYYFSNQNLWLSILLSALDTLQYVLGYYLITLLLLPRYRAHKKLLLFVLGVLLINLFLGTSRLYGYKFATSLVNSSFNPGISSYIYLYTTTFLILVASSGVKFAVDWLQSQKRIEEISKEHKEAELKFLKGQLNPHFLFNSINTLYGSIQPENELARNILLKLSDMLRYQLYECGADKVSIEKEIAYINNYVALQRLRSNNDIEIRIDIGEDVHSVEMPPLLIAPLIENSFKHVSKWNDKRNWISISIKKEANKIIFEIQNTFNAKAGHSQYGIGLDNTRKRLKLLFDSQPILEVEESGNVFSVCMKIPTL